MSFGKVLGCNDFPIFCSTYELRDIGWQRRSRLWKFELALLEDIPVEVEDSWKVIWRRSGAAGANGRCGRGGGGSC